MVRVNFDILGISKLKWTGMAECNSDDFYIYYYGQCSCLEIPKEGGAWWAAIYGVEQSRTQLQ